MSVLGKKWTMKSTSCAKPILEILLENRGLLSNEEKEAFLNSERAFHDPYLMKDMAKSVEKIKQAIANEERIIIFGDYDVDGLTSAAILYHTLKDLDAKSSVRLPNREKDGYGLSKKFIDEFEELGVKLVITVDCGISCADEITYAKEKGIETIITDHHQIPEKFPKDAYSINHPKQEDCSYPFDDLTGAGVALKLAQALLTDHPELVQKTEALTELAALGTIADLGRVKDENRLIIKKGLSNLTKTQWPGLRILKELVNSGKKEVNTETVGYQLAPRLNAAGRIGDPYNALKLLIGTDEQALYQYGKDLEALNQERRKMTVEAYAQAYDNFKFKKPEDIPYILIAHHKDWHVGILGLSASRLAEKFGKPAIVMQELGDTLVGSARSIQAFNIVEALAEAKEHLINFGGHKEAAGFTIEKANLSKFKEVIEKFAEKKLKNQDLRPNIDIDCELQGSMVKDSLIEDIYKLKPFGIRNHRPIFKIRNVEPTLAKTVGRTNDHIKFDAIINEKQIPAIGFRLGSHIDDMRRAKSIDIICYIDFNEWNGNKKLQLEIVDFKC
ncbi:single-stranded-DNA-specific exonuclease RecJ [Candidatus Peregrinibacteria bacterium]|jgi:single-stranded-DNA-specific exonuclease|nr:single-stranded-DNA-specific exonuclease RecJ [Candidatus Peregrinibacteria bacterium]MBT4056503.1 single-stranded-DNA-specific exonuclease RecJ [Candidatus Peregrinibacteria bacterium]